MDGGEESIFFTFCDLNETFIFMSKFSMEACPQMKFELVVQRKEGHVLTQKYQKLKRKLTFYIPKFKFQNGLKQKTSNFWAFLRQTCLWEPNPPKNVQVFWQILNHVTDAEILAPELVDGQSEMVVSQFCHK